MHDNIIFFDMSKDIDLDQELVKCYGLKVSDEKKLEIIFKVINMWCMKYDCYNIKTTGISDDKARLLYGIVNDVCHVVKQYKFRLVGGVMMIFCLKTKEDYNKVKKIIKEIQDGKD